MKKSSIFMLLLTVLSLAFCLTGCGGDQTTQQGSAGNPNNEQIKIGIIQLMDHEALNQAQQGFIDTLAENGYQAGENLTLLIENAQGDINNLATIADKFVAENVDLAFTIATPSTQAMASKTTTIPIVATAVTSFTVARLVASDEQPGGNITGASDLNPITDQIDLLLQLCPDVQTVGFLYTASEDNSTLQCNIAKEYLDTLQIKYVERTITNTNDIQQAVTAIVEECDAIYIPTDNNFASAMPTVASIAQPAGIPILGGEVHQVERGATFTKGITYYGIGCQAGEMALDILKNGANPATMPIQNPTEFEYCINGPACQALNITIPAELQQYVITEIDTAA